MEGVDETELERVVLPQLKPTAPLSGKQFALQYFLEFSGSDEGCTFLQRRPKFLEGIASLRKDSDSSVARLALKCLVNLTVNGEISAYLVQRLPGIGRELAAVATDPSSQDADDACGALANLTRPTHCAEAVAKELLKTAEGESETMVEKMVLTFCKLQHNPSCDLHRLALVLQNLTQVPSVRSVLMNPAKCLLPRLLCFVTFQDSAVRRRGVVGLLKNCCFDYDKHGWLLGEQVDVLPSLLLPLAGPEEFEDSVVEQLPPDLQYLPADKQREPIDAIRRDLIEALTKLTGTKAGLDELIERNTYYILRELHNWEKDPVCLSGLQILISILISDRMPGMENLAEVEIPPEEEERVQRDLEEDFKMVQESLKEGEEK